MNRQSQWLFEVPPGHKTADNINLELGWLEFESEAAVDRRSRVYVQWVQASLNRIMGAGLSVDGIAGSRTREAVRVFQGRVGLAADGMVGTQTEQALIKAGANSPPGSSGNRSQSGIYARDRCLNPGKTPCPQIPNLLSVTGIEGIPFEYPNKGSIRQDPTTRLYVVSNDRQRNRKQSFVPSVRDVLGLFVRNMRSFGMPIEAILTAGSLYCRCIDGTDKLSNHSFGDAIDVVGVRWVANGGSASRLRETIVHNFRDPEQRTLLRRINACLRLSFATVIDYNYNTAHQDHFHCDMNRSQGRVLTGGTTLVFLREALSHVLQRHIPTPSKKYSLDSVTKQALQEFSGRGSELFTQNNRQLLSRVLDQLFEQVARG